MNLPLVIAWRYLRRPTDKLVSAVGAVSILGLVIGVMALVISMALMTGYRRDLQAKLLGGNAEIYVYAPAAMFRNVTEVQRAISKVDGVIDASPVLVQQGLVSTETLPTGEQIMVKGISPLTNASSALVRKIVGPPQAFFSRSENPYAAIGSHLAARLGIKVGDTVTVTLPTDQGGTLTPRSGTFLVGRVFKTGFFDFDAHWIFLDITEARRLALTDSANLVEVRLAPGADLDIVRERIDEATRRSLSVSDSPAVANAPVRLTLVGSSARPIIRVLSNDTPSRRAATRNATLCRSRPTRRGMVADAIASPGRAGSAAKLGRRARCAAS